MILNNLHLSSLKLPIDLHQVTIGQLLADAYCSKTSLNARLEWSFGSNQKTYAQYIESLYFPYIGTRLKELKVKSSDVLTVTSYRLKTLSLPVFNQYHNLFYVFDEINKKWIKRVPENIIDILSPIVLAHLVIGDGNYQPKAKTVRIYTNAYTVEEVRRLGEAISIKYNIYVGIRHDRKDQYILAIGARELKKFQELINPYIHDSIKYRIGI